MALTEPLPTDQVRELIACLHRDGFVKLPDVLHADEVADLRQRIDRCYDDPTLVQTHNRYDDMCMVRLFELDRAFRDLAVREPLISLAEAVVGQDCHLIADGVVRNGTGQAISAFHVDDHLEFPLPEDIPRHDPRLMMPVNIVTVQVLLTDVLEEAQGPSQCVPGSHYAGRHPNDQAAPTFEGHGPVNILGRAGDVWLLNGQCWHRGAPNTSPHTRYLFQLTFGRRWVAQRFYPFLNYRMPDHVLEGAGERLLRVLGKHPKGAYG